VGLKPEAGRAERGRGADSESESESEAHKGGRREPASELQSKFREAPSGWLCRNDPGSDWALDLRATGRALALASHPSLLAGPSLADRRTLGWPWRPRPPPLLQQRIVQQPERAWADHGARVPTHDNTRAIAAFQVCHGLAPGPGLPVARVSDSDSELELEALKSSHSLHLNLQLQFYCCSRRTPGFKLVSAAVECRSPPAAPGRGQPARRRVQGHFISMPGFCVTLVRHSRQLRTRDGDVVD